MARIRIRVSLNRAAFGRALLCWPAGQSPSRQGEGGMTEPPPARTPQPT